MADDLEDQIQADIPDLDELLQTWGRQGLFNDAIEQTGFTELQK